MISVTHLKTWIVNTYICDYVLYNKEQKKICNLFQNRFFTFIFTKSNLLYIKVNKIGWTLSWWKLYLKIFYNKYFIHLWKQPQNGSQEASISGKMLTRFSQKLRKANKKGTKANKLRTKDFNNISKQNKSASLKKVCWSLCL